MNIRGLLCNQSTLLVSTVVNARKLFEPVNTRCEWAGPYWNTNQAFALVEAQGML